MKKLTTIICALAAFSLMLGSPGFAVPFSNQLGIYTDPTGDPASANYDAVVNVPFMAYLIVTNPINHYFEGGTATEEAITMIDGFECKVSMPESPNFNVLSRTYPVNMINIGSDPNYVVGFASNVPVTGTSLVLCTWQIMVTSEEEFNIYLGSTQFPSIDGEMAILDVNDSQDPLSAVYVSTGDRTVPVFSVNGTSAVATVNESWGGVKALFR